MAIDPNSPAYLFGQIIQRFDDFEKGVTRRLDAGDRRFNNLDRSVAEVKDALEKQPCSTGCVYVQQLNAAKDDQKEDRKARRDWRRALLSGVLILLISLALSAIANALKIHI